MGHCGAIKPPSYFSLSVAHSCGITLPSLPLYLSSVFYLLMRPHRFAVNLGYGFDASDSGMTSTALLFTSMFLELALEVAVDSAAVQVEHAHGIDLDKFWEMWHINPYNTFGFHISSSLFAILVSFWTFNTLPSSLYCTSGHDPCSCTGGVFTIFRTFCDARTSDTASDFGSESNKTASTSALNTTLESARSVAKSAYVGLFESLEGSAATVLISIAVVVVICLVFFAARSQLLAASAEKEKEDVDQQRLELLEVAAEAQREREEADEARAIAEAEVVELRETNLKIRKEL